MQASGHASEHHEKGPQDQRNALSVQPPELGQQLPEQGLFYQLVEPQAEPQLGTGIAVFRLMKKSVFFPIVTKIYENSFFDVEFS